MAYEFTRDFHGSRIPLFKKHLAPMVGLNGLRFLEVGSFEGQSAIWLAENVLTGKRCQLVCVDPWESDTEELPGLDMDEVAARFRSNVLHCLAPVNFEIQRCNLWEYSAEHSDPFDFIYIDGSHRAADVLTDSVIAWQLLKVGGIIAWDDLSWRRDEEGRNWDHPGTAVAAFTACMAGRYEALHAVDMMWIRRAR